MGGTKLPFDVDPDLEKEVLEYDANGANAEEKDAKTAFVWPVRSIFYHRSMNSIVEVLTPVLAIPGWRTTCTTSDDPREEADCHRTRHHCQEACRAILHWSTRFT